MKTPASILSSRVYRYCKSKDSQRVVEIVRRRVVGSQDWFTVL